MDDYDFCDCCSPGELAWAMLKAKKPFHGYNKKKHARRVHFFPFEMLHFLFKLFLFFFTPCIINFNRV